MRCHFLVPLLLLAACGRDEADTAEPTEAASELSVYTAGGRDRLCLSAAPGGQAGLITYAPVGDANCSLRGRWSDGPAAAIRPDGDDACSISIDSEGDVVTLGTPTPACAYYCGPGASLAGKTFVRMDKPAPVTDIAGEPLC